MEKIDFVATPEQQEKTGLKVFDMFEFEKHVGKMPTLMEFGHNLPLAFREFFDRMTTAHGVSNWNHKIMEYTALVEFLYPLYIANQVGFREFRINRSLATLLKDTDIPNAPLEFLQLPFEGIVLDVPKDSFSGKYKIVQRVYVCKVEGDNRFRASFVDEVSSSSYINMLINEGTTIKDAVEATTKVSQKAIASDPDLWKYHQGETFEEGARSELFKFIVNTVLYISSPDSDVKEDLRERRRLHQKLQGVKSGAKRQRLEELLKKAKSRHIYIVGAQCRDREYEKIAGAETTETGRKIMKRFRVRGHFRMQPHGKGRQLRKLSWVRPHWKGPTFAEMVQKGYIVK